ncbi:MAG: PAS domain-containing protein [Ignavibacteriaceae bacterium]|jgi:PAS domain S-box-containing protein
MTSVSLEHLELIKTLVDSTGNAFLLIDQKGNILYRNKKSIEIFSLTEEIQNFLELFDKHEVSHIEDILENLKYELFPVEKKGRFLLHTQQEYQLQFQINHYPNDGNDYYFLQFETSEPVGIGEGKTVHFSISTVEISKTFSNPELVNTIHEVQSNYPFTFLGKNKLQVSINKLEELFWLKDSENKYLLVNQNFANKLGLRISQVEGRQEEFFLPTFNLDFYNSMESFLKTTGNTLIIKGIPVKGFTDYHDYQSVVIPLLDADNKVIAELGIAQKEKVQNQFSDLQSGNYLIQDLINSILFPVCILNENARIEKANKPFSELVGLDEFSTENVHLSQIFPQSIAQEITEAIEAKTGELSVSIPFRNGKNIRHLQAKIKKLNSDKVETNAYFLVVEFLDAFDNFEAFIKTRGKMFDVLIKSLPDPILIYDAENLRFLEANDAAISLYGYSHEEFLQMDLTDLYSPEDIQTLLDTPVLNKKKNFSGPFNHKKKDGSIITVEIFKDVFTFENKEAHFTIIKNVTENFDKENEFKLYKSVYEGTDQLIAVTDNSGFIKFVNQNLVLFTGINKTSLVGNSLVSLFSDNDRGNITSKIFSAKLSESIKLPVEIKNAQKVFVPAEITAIPNLNANGITDSYNILIKIPQNEEKDIALQTVNKKSGKRLEPSQLSTIFHEILTPINVMLGFLQEVKESIPSPTADQKEALDYIQENQHELMGTMNAIAEYSTLLKEEEESQSNTFALPDLFDKVKQEFSEEPIHKKHSLITKIAPLWLEGDVRKYKMFFGTMASICAKISDENHFYFSVEQTDENDFIFSIRDELSRISEKLLFALEPVLVQNGDVSLVRPYGVSRFAILTLRELMETLNCNVEIIRKGNEPYEMGFFFPLKQFTAQPAQKQVVESKQTAEIKAVTQEITSKTTQVREEKSFQQIQAQQTPFNRRATLSDEEFEKVIPPPLSRQSEAAPMNHRRTYVEEFQEAPRVQKVLALQKLSCLYIEDQVDSQILFKVQMKELGEIKFAVSFEEALPLITSQSFDFIVMDINLQGEYNGLDALKMIHQMPGFKSLPIIAVTAYVLPGDKDKFIAAGFNEFISKPIFREKMIEALERIFLK